MRSLGIEDDDEIRRFADPLYWISYFPPLVKRDLEMMGLKVNLSEYFTRFLNRLFDFTDLDLMNIDRLIGVDHSLQLISIHSMIRLSVGNSII